jgi:hypothetical protein
MDVRNGRNRRSGASGRRNGKIATTIRIAIGSVMEIGSVETRGRADSNLSID